MVFKILYKMSNIVPHKKLYFSSPTKIYFIELFSQNTSIMLLRLIFPNKYLCIIDSFISPMKTDVLDTKQCWD